jgi:predicted protein tyrosine phosphatase
MKILFICSANIDRSPTAEKTIRESYPDIETKSAGVSRGARVPVSEEHIEWTDVVLCMENYHKRKLQEMFSNILEGKELSYLNIPDYYHYMEPDLIRIIKERFDRWLSEYQEKERIAPDS